MGVLMNNQKMKKDINIQNIKEAGRLAIEIAIEDYKNGDLAPDIFEQIGRALFIMQKESKKLKKGKLVK